MSDTSDEFDEEAKYFDEIKKNAAQYTLNVVDRLLSHFITTMKIAEDKDDKYR